MLLGELLKERRIQFSILSRGYGRKTRGVALVDPDGSPNDFGDEPLLIARRLNVPVIIGESRYQAGVFAEKKYGPHLHLLDDGFQHRALARDFDIVLLSPSDLRDHLLPSGRLREPLSSLRRADAIVVGDQVNEIPNVKSQSLWKLHRGISLANPPQYPAVFCGIARPERFVTDLKQSGVVPVAQHFFRDHHSYSATDVDHLLTLKQSSGATGFITTEKDAIKLGRHRFLLEPLCVVTVAMSLENPSEFMTAMLASIEIRKPIPAAHSAARGPAPA
jgi:tetraacyldisaccharide 4'-kinase